MLIGILSLAAGGFGYWVTDDKGRSERLQMAALLTVVAFIALQLLAELMAHQPCPSGYEPYYSSPDHSSPEYTCVLV